MESLAGIPPKDHLSVAYFRDGTKIYFDEQDDMSPQYQLVCRLLPNEVQAAFIEAIALGERNALQIYLEAAKRVGRHLCPDTTVHYVSTHHMVELRGIEPLTSSLRTRRATNCATAPYGQLRWYGV